MNAIATETRIRPTMKSFDHPRNIMKNPPRSVRRSARASFRVGCATLLLAFVFAMQTGSAATKSPPLLLNFQGYLEDASGNPFGKDAPVNQDVVFRIYEAPTGGAALWAERQTVTLDRGTFSVQLGAGIAEGTELHGSLGDVFLGSTASDRYLGISVVDNGSEISPRLRFLTSPYAFLSAQARKLVNDDGTIFDPFTGGGAADFTQITSPIQSITGEARGSQATDLQIERLVNTQVASGDYSVISGGLQNTASKTLSTVGGGQANVASGAWTTISGGISNEATEEYAVVGGGKLNKATGANSTIAGGSTNTASGLLAVVSGGWKNEATGVISTVGGGERNEASGIAATIGGGIINKATQQYAVVGGGKDNEASAVSSTVGGGLENEASEEYSAVLGGFQNTASGNSSFVGGGRNNIASGFYGVVIGGEGSTASKNYTLAAGRQAKALHEGAFVWADSAGADFVSIAEDEFAVRASGGVRLVSGTATATLAPNATSWSVTSDRGLKKAFTSIDPNSILEKLDHVPVSAWRYDWDADDAVKHIGPMAQDFKQAFYPGRDDKSITTLEMDGVALAAIKGLKARDDQKSQRITELESENETLKQTLADLLQRVQAIEAKTN